jgi:ferredoxin-type protein NapF
MDLSRRRFFARRHPGPAPFRPPWSLPEAQFTDRCSRCDECVKACPTGLLVRGGGGYPLARFAAAACSFCGDCATICPTGALARAGDRAPWSFGIRIGGSCLPEQGVECRVCGEACDVGAIRFRPRTGGVTLPEVDNAACTGCGACISPCPVMAIERIALNLPSALASFSPLIAECS